MADHWAGRVTSTVHYDLLLPKKTFHRIGLLVLRPISLDLRQTFFGLLFSDGIGRALVPQHSDHTKPMER